MMETGSAAYRTERDIVGTLAVPVEAYYGVHTLRAMQNFPITGQRLLPEMIESIALIKKAAALTSRNEGALAPRIADAIAAACDEIIAGRLHDQFTVDPVQGGAGTSVNMNANEVIANRAIELLGGQKGDYALVHPNDHVNLGQSTNDVYPSCGKLTLLRLSKPLDRALDMLSQALFKKARQFDGVVKMGRTQLQDAVPIRLGQEFHAYATAVERCHARLRAAMAEMLVINLGGTAVGTGINASGVYARSIVAQVHLLSGEPFTQAEDLIDATQNLDACTHLSAALKTCAVTLSKISNDLRLMSSGPRAGFGEITLPARQNGSSIMPGKVNPVIPEVVNQIAFAVIGNDTTVTLAAEAGQLELNAFEPILFYRLFESVTLLTHGAETLAVNCIEGIVANERHCRELVDQSAGVAAALCPRIGYARASSLAKEALSTHTSVEALALRDGLLPAPTLQRLLDPYAMTISPAQRKQVAVASGE